MQKSYIRKMCKIHCEPLPGLHHMWLIQDTSRDSTKLTRISCSGRGERGHQEEERGHQAGDPVRERPRLSQP